MVSVFRGSENDIHSEFLESEGSVLELFLDPYQISEFSLSAYTPPAEPEMPIMTPNGTTTLGSVPTPTEDVSFVTHFFGTHLQIVENPRALPSCVWHFSTAKFAVRKSG